jgi:hypothetical protein
MAWFLGLLPHALASPFKSQVRLEAEIVFLRHQLNLLWRRLPAKPRLTTEGQGKAAAQPLQHPKPGRFPLFRR